MVLSLPRVIIYLSSMGDHAEMLRKTKLLAETTASVIGLLKMEADDEMDPAARQRLLDAARALADATSHMVEAAKMAAQNPGVGDLDFVFSKDLSASFSFVRTRQLKSSCSWLRRISRL